MTSWWLVSLEGLSCSGGNLSCLPHNQQLPWILIGTVNHWLSVTFQGPQKSQLIHTGHSHSITVRPQIWVPLLFFLFWIEILENMADSGECVQHHNAPHQSSSGRFSNIESLLFVTTGLSIWSIIQCSKSLKCYNFIATFQINPCVNVQ